MDEYSPLVDFMANEYLGGRTMLYMLDAIICAPSERLYSRNLGKEEGIELISIEP